MSEPQGSDLPLAQEPPQPPQPQAEQPQQQSEEVVSVVQSDQEKPPFSDFQPSKLLQKKNQNPESDLSSSSSSSDNDEPAKPKAQKPAPAPKSAAGSSSTSSSSDDFNPDGSSSSSSSDNEDTKRKSTTTASTSSARANSDSNQKPMSMKQLAAQYSLDPELYGLRRSSRAPKVRQESDDDSEPIHRAKRKMPAKKEQAAKRSAPPKAKKPGRRKKRDDSDSDMESEPDSASDADYFDDEPPRKKAAVNRKPNKATADQWDDLRISRPGAKKYAEEDDLDLESEEFVASWSYVDPNAEEYESAVEGIDRIMDHREVEIDGVKSLEFLVNWNGKSDLHNTWHTAEALKTQKGFKKIENYLKKLREMEEIRRQCTREQIEQFDVELEMKRELLAEFQKVERVVAMRNGAGEAEYLCKWKELSYSDCTWEPASLISKDFQKEIDDFIQRSHFKNAGQQRKGANRVAKKLTAQPSYLVGGQLRDYQLEGLNWLAFAWSQGNNTILADEMGLGKTCQTISFLSYLFHTHSIHGPFLVIVPLSTITAWQREFERWAPDINVVPYVGSKKSREVIREYEFYTEKNRQLKFHALLTTYELLLKDADIFRPIKWQALAVDEAHRLKNADSQLYDTLRVFSTEYRLLITGTPLQNSIRELWALLSFLEPEKFDSLQSFESAYSELQQESQIKKLHQELHPHLLRRVKKDVEKSLPSKVERILRVGLTEMQKQYYKWILTKNYKALNKGSKTNQVSLQNVVMELKKCCNHPFLFEGAEAQIPHNIGHEKQVWNLINNSGKLILLDKLLVRLKESGHRVLIFSQMVKMLDILGDYLALRGFTFQRLDGSVSSDKRKQAMDHFNAPDSTDFCFLLSTRAGGLGINLATADTVILFDSDWNPQNDLQAQARAHRIGQKSVVNIYRLVTKATIEEDIIERAKRKMVLDHLIIQKMDTSGNPASSKDSNPTQFSKDELQAILKFGAEELFKEEPGKPHEEVDLDEILKRAETRETEDPGQAHSEFLGQFKVADFGDWDQIIPEPDRRRVDEEEEQRQLEADLVFEPRKRKAVVKYHEEIKEESEAERKKKAAKQSKPSNTGSPATQEGFTEKEVRGVHRGLMKFGTSPARLDAVIQEAGTKRDKQEVLELIKRLTEETKLALERAKEGSVVKESGDDNNDDDKEKEKDKEKDIEKNGVEVTYGGFTFRSTWLQRMDDIDLLDRKVSPVGMSFRFATVLNPVKDWKEWNPICDAMLAIGVNKHGFGCWKAIREDPELGLTDKIFDGEKGPDGKDLLPKPPHISRRMEYLFKVLREEERERAEKKSHPKVKIFFQNKDADQSTEKMDVVNSDDDFETTKKVIKVKPPRDPTDREKDKEKEKEKEKDRDRDRDREKDKDREKSKEKSRDKEKKSKPKDKSKSGKHDAADSEQEVLDEKVYKECHDLMQPVEDLLKQFQNSSHIQDKMEKLSVIKKTLLAIGEHLKSVVEAKDADLKEKERLEQDLWTFVSQKSGHAGQDTGEKMKSLFQRLHDPTKLESPDHKKTVESKVSQGKSEKEMESGGSAGVHISLKKRKSQPEGETGGKSPKKSKDSHPSSGDIRHFFAKRPAEPSPQSPESKEPVETSD